MSSFQLQNQRTRGNIFSIKKRREALLVEQETEMVKESDLKLVKGIGEATMSTLYENGITTKAELMLCDVEKLKEIIKNPLTLKNIESFIKESTFN